MSLVIPKFPDHLLLEVRRLFNGDRCLDDRLFGDVAVSSKPEGLLVRAEAPVLLDQNIPDAPIGSRVEKLWETDVLELFLVGPGHQYLELELGAGGHWLVYEFDRIRHINNFHEELDLVVSYNKTENKTWVSETVLPWKLFPENFRSLNAFMIVGEQFLSFSPVPGDIPDFHQPDYFPSASINRSV